MGHYLTINGFTKNVSGNQRSTNKHRGKLQVNIIGPTKESLKVLDDVIGLDKAKEDHDVFITTDPKAFGKQHNKKSNQDDEEEEDEEEDE